MQRIKSVPGIFVLILALAGTAVGQGSNVDLAEIVSPGGQIDTPGAIGLAMSSLANGFTYVVGVTNTPDSFLTTPGALRSEGTNGVVFAQKIAADGSVAASALIAEGYAAWCAAKIDSDGNIYVALAAWAGPGSVIKVGPQLDRILYTTPVGDIGGPVSLDFDSDGSAVVGFMGFESARLVKLDPSGALTNISYTFTEPPPESGRDAYDGRWIGVAIAPDHSIAVAISPIFVYRLDRSGQLIYRAPLGDADVDLNEEMQLSALCLDPDGNAYVAAFSYHLSAIPLTATQIDYTNSSSQLHSFVTKLDAAGKSVYTAAFATEQVTALASSGSGAIWGAGSATWGTDWTTGLHVFQLDTAGDGFLHYLTIPADSSIVTSLSIDGLGRPSITGKTASSQLPDTGASRPPSSSSDPNWNAFFVRVKSNPAAADLQITLTALESAVPNFGTATYRATITNAGPAAATDVRIALVGYLEIDAANVNTYVISCNISGGGVCVKNWSAWRIAFPSLAPGETGTIEFQITIPSPAPSPFPVSVAALTSADDPGQLNNNAYAEVAIQTSYLNIGANIPLVNLQMDGSVPGWAIGSFTNHIEQNPGVPASPGQDVNVFVPSPQLLFGSMYAFAGWSDGSLENPRTFSPGTSSAVDVKMRQITEPWVNPDAPVQNAGSYRGGAIAPGEIVTLFGYNLGPKTAVTAALDDTGRIATNVGGFQVLFDGVAAPVIYASAVQSSVIVPYELAGKQSVQMTIQYNGLTSAPVTVPVAESAPGFLTANYSGSGQILAFNSDGSLNSRNAQARRGDIVVLYGTGEGVTNPLPQDGEIAGASPPKPQLPVSITIGGQPAEILYAGGTGNVTAGLLQLNVRVPANVTSGLLPVLLTIGSNTSQREATIAVQ